MPDQVDKSASLTKTLQKLHLTLLIMLEVNYDETLHKLHLSWNNMT